jgi:hypothetical protein
MGTLILSASAVLVDTAEAREAFMSVVFDVIDIMHKIIVKFVRSFLPEAKKPYNLKPVHQPVLNVHGVASKADVYNIGVAPNVIEEGLNAGLKLMRYLAADGYRIKTPLFNLAIRVPGEYDGNETCLPEGVHPVVRMRSSVEFRQYIRERVKVLFDGVDTQNGYISEFLDIEENSINSLFFPGDQFVMTGSGIKAEGPDPSCGVFFVPQDDPSHEVRVTRIANNTRSRIIGVCPQTGHQYNRIVIRTQYSNSSKYLKTVRTIESSFLLEES